MSAKKINEVIESILSEIGFLDASFTLDLGGMTPLPIAGVDSILDPEKLGLKWNGAYDSNNGTAVIYDFEGRPYIIKGQRGYDCLYDAVNRINKYLKDQNHRGLRENAFVPHSNDGGWLTHTLFPGEDGAPKQWTVVVGLQTFVVNSPVSAQLLLLAKDQDRREKEGLVRELTRLATMVEDGKLPREDVMAQAITAAKEAYAS